MLIVIFPCSGNGDIFTLSLYPYFEILGPAFILLFPAHAGMIPPSLRLPCLVPFGRFSSTRACTSLLDPANTVGRGGYRPPRACM